MGLIIPHDPLRYSLALLETAGIRVESYVNYYNAIPPRYPAESSYQHRLRIYFERTLYDQSEAYLRELCFYVSHLRIICVRHGSDHGRLRVLGDQQQCENEQTQRTDLLVQGPVATRLQVGFQGILGSIARSWG